MPVQLTSGTPDATRQAYQPPVVTDLGTATGATLGDWAKDRRDDTEYWYGNR